MKSILSEPAGTHATPLPDDDIASLINARDIISLVSRPYFTTAIKSLYPSVMNFIDNQDMIQQVMVTVYYQDNQSNNMLQVIKTNLVSAFQDCSDGSIALAELMFKHPVVLESIFKKLAEMTVLNIEKLVVPLDNLNTPSNKYFFEVVTAALSSFTLHYEHLVAFINYLLASPDSFDSLVSLSGYTCFQNLLEMLFTVKLNRTMDVTMKIASAWYEGGMGSRMLNCLINSFSYKKCTITCIDLTRGIAEILIKGLLMGIEYIVRSVLDAIPALTQIVMFSDQSKVDEHYYLEKSEYEDTIRMRADSFHSLVDLWICAVRCLMIQLHQAAISTYSYQDHVSHAPGTIITVDDMKEQGISVAETFHRFTDVLQAGDFSAYLTDGYMHPPVLHITLHRLRAIARLLCVAGDIRSFYYFKTRGYYPTDHFMDPENTHCTNNHQIGKVYGALPPIAYITIVGSDDIPIEELCQTDTGAILEGSMWGVVKALLQANLEIYINHVFNNPCNNLQCTLSCCTTINSLLLEYRFMIPQLTEKVVGNKYIAELFSDTLEIIRSKIPSDLDTSTKFASLSRGKLSLPLRTVFVCCFVQNLYKMLGNEGDRKQLIGKRLLSKQNINISFTSESQKQKRGPDPLAPFLSEKSTIHSISTLNPYNQSA